MSLLDARVNDLVGNRIGPTVAAAQDALVEGFASHLPGMAPAVRAIGLHLVNRFDVGNHEPCSCATS